MKSEPLQIRDWYKAVKAESGCITCDHQQPGKVEFHHIDASTKKDCISKLVYGNIIFPSPYAAVTVAVEFMKCVPLCPAHHAELHRLEKSDPQAYAEKYDFSNDGLYADKILTFRENVIENIPDELVESIKSGLDSISEEGAFLALGYAL
jgi:hypothetical protein